MHATHRIGVTTMLTAGLALVPMTGCEDLPGNREQQSTVIGGAAGAAAGALIGGEDNRLVGALIGGALGAGGGYLIGAKTDWFEDDNEDASEEARQAVDEATADPATAAQARAADTADINDDGFVTLDEVVAMEQAGFSNPEMLRRLRATDQVFDLSASQRQHLLDEGVSDSVVDALPDINRATRDELLGPQDDVISAG